MGEVFVKNIFSPSPQSNLRELLAGCHTLVIPLPFPHALFWHALLYACQVPPTDVCSMALKTVLFPLPF